MARWRVAGAVHGSAAEGCRRFQEHPWEKGVVVKQSLRMGSSAGISPLGLSPVNPGSFGVCFALQLLLPPIFSILGGYLQEKL